MLKKRGAPPPPVPATSERVGEGERRDAATRVDASEATRLPPRSRMETCGWFRVEGL